MRAAIEPLSRYIAGLAQGKRILFCWCRPVVCPSNLTNVFAFEDDYAMGILSSRIHGEWARAQSSTLRLDVRYTPTSAFETYPWPDASDDMREQIGTLTRELLERRATICHDQEIGLTQLYNQIGEGAWTALRDLHRRLDEMVAKAYGWPVSVASDIGESNSRLLALNGEIASGAQAYAPFTQEATRASTE